MKILSNSDYNLFKSIVSLKQGGMRKTLGAYLEKKYDKVHRTKDYILAEGEIPIALVAHMDTVFKEPPKNIYYDERQGVMWSPDGLGADDRAGIFAILKILQTGLRPTIIFTADEEVGALGALSLTKHFTKSPVDLKYIIQLDRRGTNDCVFYDCDNPEFVQYVESFGFIENFGSFSDISVICPAWGIAGVNLSIGYEDEHSFVETFHIQPFLKTITNVIKMLNEQDIPAFKYIPARNYPWLKSKGVYSSWLEDEDDIELCICSNCGKKFLDYEMIPATSNDGTKKYFCSDCSVDNVGWCMECGDSFETKDPVGDTVCPSCQKNHKKKEKKSAISRNNSKAV